MEKELKFKPGQRVTVRDVRNASAVGYLGTHHTIVDYVAMPNFLKKDRNGEWLYPCMGDDRFVSWFYEDEIGM